METPNIEKRPNTKQLRKQIEQQIDEFFRNGGEVEHIDPVEPSVESIKRHFKKKTDSFIKDMVDFGRHEAE